MAGQLNNYNFVRKMDIWSDKVTQKAHLGAMLVKSQQEGYGQRATNTMIRLMSADYGNSMESFLSKYPTKEFEDDTYIYWNVIGSSIRNEPLIEARTEDGTVVTDATGMVGANTVPFYLVFSTNMFHDGEFIVGNLNYYQYRVLGDPVEEGTNFRYKVELAGGNDEGVPAERLLAGERFSIGAAFVESGLSRRVGGVNFASPTMMRNEWSTIRLDKKVSGDMLKEGGIKLNFPVMQKDGSIKTFNTWMLYCDWQIEQTFARYKRFAYTDGRSNRNAAGEYKNIGKSGNVIKVGAAIFQQMEYGNVTYYNDFSLKLLEEAISAVRPKGNYNKGFDVVLQTGMHGALLFNKAVDDRVSGWTKFQFNGDQLGVLKKTSADFTGKTQALSAGYQFTEYLSPMGISIKLMVMPYYDDIEHDKIQHHLGGSAYSYIFDIFDMGSEQEPNIFKCKVKGIDSETRSYTWGFRNPFTGQFGNPNMSYDEDSASVTKFTQTGVCILDPSRVMRILPSELCV